MNALHQPTETADLIDIGANLTHKSFRKDLDAVLARAGGVGVQQLVVTGTSVHGSTEAQLLAAAYEQLFSTAGIHPHDAKEGGPAAIATLRSLAATSEVVAIGECGLDYNRDFSPRDVQRQCFEAQLQLAAETGLPVFLHERDAHDDFLAMLVNARPTLRAIVVHCFTGSAAELEAYLALDAHIGITGWICDERRGSHLQRLVANIPANRLMVETDAPFLLPRDMRPKPKSRRNEPSYLPHVLSTVARCRQEDPLTCARETTATARSFFALPG